MLNVRIGVVENEEDVAKADVALLERYAKENEINIETKIFLNAFEFLDSEEQFDALLMDIDMPGMNGMKASEEIRKTNESVDIIFTTNLPQFAIDGYKVHALDFVIKPVTFPNLSFAMDKVVEKKRQTLNGSFFLKIGGLARRFNNSDLIYFEMVNHNIVLHEEGLEPFKVRGSLKLIEEIVNQDVFVKINSGIIINLSKVKFFADGTVTMDDGSILPVSRSHKKDFAVRLSKFYGNSLDR